MQNHINLQLVSRDSVFGQTLTLDNVRAQAPAVFAERAHESRSARYTFIPTNQVLAGLMNAGFVPVEARQATTRSKSAAHARHVVRLRRRYESVQLRDAVPEIVFLNSHDGTSAYQIRLGLFRAVCTNGLIVSHAVFPTVSVAHRGNVVDEVVAAAVRMAEGFDAMASQVEKMERRPMELLEQLHFAEKAVAVRYPEGDSGMVPSQLLTCRRPEDAANNLWCTLNRCQENLLTGGLTRRSATGRLSRTRRITSIRQDVRVNDGLWALASEVLAA
jgi:hypothetical protein